MKELNMKLTGVFLVICGLLQAQAQDENTGRMAAGMTPIFRTTVTARTAKAINYQHRSGATKIDFAGTSLLANARGEAKVESKQGYTEIEVEFDNLQPASKLGSEYLTYVMWAVTPEGRAVNLGELLLNGTKARLNVTTPLQVFGLVVTAEPYFAVSSPSDLVVLENKVRSDTKGKIEEIEAKYELLERGQYARLSNPLALKMDKKIPLELYQARNAVQIARSIGADRFATETFQKAEQSLTAAESYQTRKSGTKPVTRTAREAVQTAEDARAIAVKRQEAEALTTERQQSANRELQAESGRAAAQSEANRVTQNAETARIVAQANTDRLNQANAKLTSEKDAQAAASIAEANRVSQNAETARIAAQANTDRLNQENAKLTGEKDAQTAASVAEANRVTQNAETARIAAQADTDRLNEANAKLTSEKDAQAAASIAEANRVKGITDASKATDVAEAERLRIENNTKLTAAGAETSKLKRESDFRTAVAGVEADRLKYEGDARLAAANQESDRLKRENAQQKDANEAILADASKQKKQMEAEKAELRSQLLVQFNAVLQTRDSARGLIVNMADVLFDTDKFTLRPVAKEKLAKVVGIVSGHPGLHLDVEGHTDSVGGDEYNQTLSEKRGNAVRDYLTGEGMSQASVTSKGFGKTKPVETNDTAAGRQLNRRVEIVISGEAIGVDVGTN